MQFFIPAFLLSKLRVVSCGEDSVQRIPAKSERKGKVSQEPDPPSHNGRHTNRATSRTDKDEVRQLSWVGPPAMDSPYPHPVRRMGIVVGARAWILSSHLNLWQCIWEGGILSDINLPNFYYSYAPDWSVSVGNRSKPFAYRALVTHFILQRDSPSMAGGALSRFFR